MEANINEGLLIITFNLPLHNHWAKLESECNLILGSGGTGAKGPEANIIYRRPSEGGSIVAGAARERSTGNVSGDSRMRVQWYSKRHCCLVGALALYLCTSSEELRIGDFIPFGWGIK
jgi:hypothetical protein